MKTQRESISSLFFLVLAFMLFLMTEIMSTPLRALASTPGRNYRMSAAELRRNNEELRASALSLADFQMKIDAINSDRYSNWLTLSEDIAELRSKISRSFLSAEDRSQLLDELEEKRKAFKKQFPQDDEPGLL